MVTEPYLQSTVRFPRAGKPGNDIGRQTGIRHNSKTITKNVGIYRVSQDDGLDDDDSDHDRQPEHQRPTTSPGVRPVMSRPNTREVDPEVEEAVNRKIEAVTAKRLAQVKLTTDAARLERGCF